MAGLDVCLGLHDQAPVCGVVCLFEDGGHGLAGLRVLLLEDGGGRLTGFGVRHGFSL